MTAASFSSAASEASVTALATSLGLALRDGLLISASYWATIEGPGPIW